MLGLGLGLGLGPTRLGLGLGLGLSGLDYITGNGTKFSYVIFTEQRNFTTAERRNGNGRTATE